MPQLSVTEHSAIGGGGNHPVSGAQWPPIDQQVVAIGGSSIQSTVFHGNTTMLRVNTDSACCINIGPNPTASLVMARMSAGQTEYFSIPPNSGYQIAVIGTV